MTVPPVHVVPGPRRHGVNEHALRVAEAVGAQVLCPSGPAHALELLDRRPGVAVHLHVTDHLWGSDPGAAADAIEQAADGRALTLTLHDLPQPSDGEHHEARSAAYAAISELADGVVLSSHHERDLLRRTGSAAEPAVIPLPVDPLPAPARRPDGDRQVTISGYLYPGKGHAEAIDALAALPRDVGVVALGAPSPGCDWLEADLVAHAELRGRRFAVTGYIDDDQWFARLRGAGIPLAAHAHISASASIASWIAAGRRPLVAVSPYAAELAERAPGAVRCYRPGELPGALRAALACPASTWHDGDVGLPATADVAARYLDWWEGLG